MAALARYPRRTGGLPGAAGQRRLVVNGAAPHSAVAGLTVDVVVIGGGPGGSAAAISCADSGLAVALVEKQSFPRARPGESLHPGVEPILVQLSAWEQVNRHGFLRFPGIKICWADQSRFDRFESDWKGLQAWRPDFDEILLEQARKTGTAVIQPSQALALLPEGVLTDAGLIRCGFIVDASGAKRWSARALRSRGQALTKPLICRYGYEQAAGDEWPELVATEAGWRWTAQVRPDLRTWVDVAPKEVPRPRVPGMQAADVTWRASRPFAAVLTGGILLFRVGDAAFSLDPASSRGVLKALMSGIMAVHAVRQVVRRILGAKQACAGYAEWMEGWLQRDAGRLRELYSEHPVLRRIFLD